MGQSRNADRHESFSARLETAVQAAVVGARRRWTAPALARDIAAREACARSLVRGAIRRLIEKGLIEYRYTFGQSYLEMSFRQPVEIGGRFTILPSDYTGRVAAERLPLFIGPGSAFGSGRHPTTRLALLAMEKAWESKLLASRDPMRSVIDIGTGSGILAIAAARLGAVTVTALDIDPCARTEAAANIARNTQTAVITVTSTPLDQIDGSFDAVIANLRLPTLIQLRGWVGRHLSAGGGMVVSGLRDSEWGRLEEIYRAAGWRSVWRHCEAGWAGGLLGHQGGHSPGDHASEA